MRKSIKKMLMCGLAAGCIIASSTITRADTIGFGTTLPSTGYATGGTAEKTDAAMSMILKVTNTGNNNEYHFWDYKSGDSPSNRQTTDASASGTGVKYAYYATATQANGLYLAGARLGVTVKTGPTVFTPMWIEALFTP